MKKLIIAVLASATLLISCKPNPVDYIGKWRGGVLVVTVEYIFSKTEFESRTLSFNDVMIHGAKGRLRVEGNSMFMDEEEKYIFDTDLNQGKWIKSDDSYMMTYTINGKEITLKPSDADDTITLKWQ